MPSDNSNLLPDPDEVRAELESLRAERKAQAEARPALGGPTDLHDPEVVRQELEALRAQPDPALGPDRAPATEDDDPWQQDLLEGIDYGLRMNTSFETAEDWKEPRSGWEIATAMATDLAKGYVGSAAVGAALVAAAPAAVPAAAGALAGSLVWGLYSGYQRERVRSEVEGQEMSPWRVAGSAALEINPILPSSGKLLNVFKRGAKVGAAEAGKAVRVAGQIAGEGALEYAHSEDLAQAGGVAALTTIMSPLIAAGMRKPPVSVDVATDGVKLFEGNTGRKIMTKVERRWQGLDQAAKTMPKDTEVPLEFKGFMVRGAGGDKLDDAYQRVVSKMDPKKKQEAWELFKRSELAVDEAGKVKRELMEELSEQGKDDVINIVEAKVKDPHYLADDMSRALGWDFEGQVFDAMSKAKDSYTLNTAGMFRSASVVRKAQKRLDISSEDMGKALAGREDLVDPAVLKKLKSAEGQKVFEGWRRELDKVRESMLGEGLDVGYLDNYLPTKTLKGGELAAALDRKISKIDTQAKSRGVRFEDWLQEASEGQDVIDVWRHATRAKDNVLPTKEDLLKLANEVTEQGKTRMGFEPGSVFAKRGDAPDFIREWNVGKVYTAYVNQNMKSVIYRRAFQQADTAISMLQSAGLERSAKYVQKYLQHMAGGNTGPLALANTLGEKLKRKAYRSDSEMLQKVARSGPEFMSWLQMQAYPAYLGFNMKATVRNLGQNYAVTAPEIGGAYGYKSVSRAVLEAGRDIKRRGTKAVFDDLRAKGILGSEEALDLRPDDLGLGGELRRYSDQIAEKVMYTYKMTDDFNRLVSWNTGRVWAQDVMSGNTTALKRLKNLGGGTSSRLEAEWDQITKTKDVDRLAEILGEHLVTRTQFRYGREQLSEFGRETGRAITMFTKWPVMIWSDVRNVYKHQQSTADAIQRLSQKHAPFFALMAVQAGLDETMASDEDAAVKGWLDYLTGGDLKGFTPTSSLFSNPFSASPLMEGLMQTAQAAGDVAQGEKSPLELGGRAFDEVTQTYVPVLSTVRNELDRYYSKRLKEEKPSSRAGRQLKEWLYEATEGGE